MKIAIEIMRWFLVTVWIVLGIGVLSGYPLSQFLTVLAIIWTVIHFVTLGRD